MSDTSAQTSTGDKQRTQYDLRRWLSLFFVATAVVAFSLTLLFDSRAKTLEAAPRAEPSINAEPSIEAALEPSLEPAVEPSQGPNYSRFTHTNANHAALPCLLCHRREDAPTRPRLPGHSPCAGCHAPQFADQSNPICTICHTNPPGGDVKAFPRLRSFNMRFDHARHARGAARPRNDCATCHRPTRRGVALSIPAGLNAHTVCYQCHAPRAESPESGRDISSCATCHQPGRFVRTPETARAYSVNFSHSEHTRKGLSCRECHDVLAGRPQRQQVTSPQPLMHHASPRAESCMTCHNNKRAFGGDDFSDCKRCHEGNTWYF